MNDAMKERVKVVDELEDEPETSETDEEDQQ